MLKKLIHCEILTALPCIHYNSLCVHQSAAHQGSDRDGNSHEMPGEWEEEEERKATIHGKPGEEGGALVHG